MKFKIFLVLLFLTPCLQTRARLEGPEKLDSLLKEVPKTRHDTSQVKLYQHICIYYELADASRGLEWGMKALELSKKIRWEKGIITSTMEIGLTYQFLGNYPKSAEYLEQALKLAKESGDETMIGLCIGNLGTTYSCMSDYPNALKCFHEELRLSEKRGNKGGVSLTLLNIALINQNTGKSALALGYYSKAVKVLEEKGERYYLGIAWSNMGSVYQSLKNFPKALEFFEKALRLAQELDNKYLISMNFQNMGSMYNDLGDYYKSLECFNQALAVAEEIKDVQGIGTALVNIGGAYKKIATDTVPKGPERKHITVLNKEELLKNAVGFLEKAKSIAHEIKAPELEMAALNGLYEVYDAMPDYRKALDAFRSAKVIGDTLFSVEKQKQIAGLEAKRENEVKQKEIEVLSERNRRQRVLIFSTLGGLLMLAVIVAVVIILLRNKRRAHANLQEKDAVIQSDLDKAREYIISLLPAAKKSDTISADWLFLPSSKLGGDAFGYHWIDPDHFAFYILDVCGHGVGPALHAVSVMNILNSRTQISMDLKNPAEVLSGLNEAFQYEEHGGLFFSMWYGVYRKSDASLTYVNAGHPAPLMVGEQDRVVELGPANVAVGWKPGFQYISSTVDIIQNSRILLFSDGVYEFDSPTGQTVLLKNFYEFLGNNLSYTLQDFHDRLKNHYQASSFPDDYSMVKIVFGE